MKKDIFYSGIFFLLLLFYSFYLSTFREMNFGGEYGCIANAIIRGEGFSDPFCSSVQNSGKTAWMPPFLSYFQVFLFIISGQNPIFSSWLQIFICTFAAAFSLFLILRLANEVKSRFRHLCILIFSGYILMNPNPFLLSFHDVWLISFAAISVVYVLYFYFIKKSLSVVPLFCLLLFLPLISPILSFSLVCIIGFLFLRNWTSTYLQQKHLKDAVKTAPYSFYRLSIYLFAFSIPILFWGSRNYITFNKFIPVKSNLWFDFYQANVYDEDGLMTGFTFANFHPMKNKTMLLEYQKTGEMELMEKYKNESFAYLNNNLPEYLRKVKNRLFTIFIKANNPFDEDHKIKEEALGAADITLLKAFNILSANNSLNMQMDEKTFSSIINDLDLDNKIEVIHMWQNAKNAYDSEQNFPVRILESLLIASIPFLAWLLSLFYISRFSKDARELFFILSLLYLTYLLPYALITVLSRYAIALSAVFSLMLYFATVPIFNKMIPHSGKGRKTDLPEMEIPQPYSIPPLNRPDLLRK